ncbi:MAG: acetyl-CoA carboxylase biotin carboxyl carrier protein [Lentisphaeria bacterium]|nr:acetyl-CoA carboxylase biotin carboxyl carrier protein [Lentisphaeria bacterium]MBR2720316.1 acetyl-CoA carboxylase biotin carboxyl carrier protein [Lentisphaeria bacterium]
MNFDEIRNLVKLMGEYNLTEVKIESEDCNLCFRRGDDRAPMAPVAVPAVMPVAAPAPAPAADNTIDLPLFGKDAAPAETIDSPLVGTFYRAPGPDAAPFVQVGDRVNPDTVLGIIEAMKVMNEIKAEKSGVIKEILIENGQPVEFGQPMFVLG